MRNYHILKLIFKILLVGIPLSLFVSNCYYDSEEYLFPVLEGQCDTTNITFSGTVKTLLSERCFACHSNTTYNVYGGNIKLEDYSDVKLRVDDGRLIGSVRREAGFSPMPKGSSKLTDCKISLLEIWVANGAPNN